MTQAEREATWDRLQEEALNRLNEAAKRLKDVCKGRDCPKPEPEKPEPQLAFRFG